MKGLKIAGVSIFLSCLCLYRARTVAGREFGLKSMRSLAVDVEGGVVTVIAGAGAAAIAVTTAVATAAAMSDEDGAGVGAAAGAGAAGAGTGPPVCAVANAVGDCAISFSQSK